MTYMKEYRNDVIRSVQYPDVRFSCQFCGSLDVVVGMDGFSNPSVIKCLDCGKNELEVKLNELETVKVCLC
jgi:transcription elongation factor Elf1